jgi:hypothetical protein
MLRHPVPGAARFIDPPTADRPPRDRLVIPALEVLHVRAGRLLASNSLIASISINFRSDEAVHVTTDRSGPTGNVPLHENRLAS